MLSNRLVMIAAPVGALLMLLASLTPYRVFAVISDQLGVAEIALASHGGLTVAMLMGLAGACLFSAGMISATTQHVQPTPKSKALLIVATLALGLACLLIGYGNSQLMSAFRWLATAEMVDEVTFRGMTGKARLPVLLGYISVAAGASAVFWSSRAALPQSPSPYAASRKTAVIVACGAAGLLCLATLWTAWSVYSFLSDIGRPTQIRPAELAQSISGMLQSVYLSLVGLAGAGLACLLMCVSQPKSG